jgi:ankyrin repeat protein
LNSCCQQQGFVFAFKLMSDTNDAVTQIICNMGNGEAIVGVETALMRSIIMGTATEVQQELLAQPNLSARDRDERTPWLLSIYNGDIEKAEILWTAAIDPTDRGKHGKTADPELILANLRVLNLISHNT